MTAKLTATQIDTSALALLGRAHLAKIEARLGRVERALQRGVPLALVDAVLAPDFDARLEPVVHVQRWAEERPDGIQVLRAGLGVGKSVGATVYAIATGAHWVRASEVAAWTFADQGARSQAWIDAPDLVIDEVGGQGSVSSVEATRIAIVLLERWARGRPTLVTTNLARRAFAEVYDGADDDQTSRILDRIAERGDWRDCKGPSRRKAPADVKAGRRRLEDWRRLANLVDRVELAASGYEVPGIDDDDGPKVRLAAIIGAKPNELAAARREIDARAQREAAFVAPFLARWEAELRQEQGERAATTDTIRGLLEQARAR